MHQGTFQDINGFGASPDGIGDVGPGSHRMYHPAELPPLGASVTLAEDSVAAQPNPLARTLKVAYGLASIAGAGLGAYHGYKRNDSVGWAIGWAVLGSLFPVITIPVSLAQGFGKRKGR